MMVFKARDIVLDPTVVPYTELRYIEDFSTDKFHHFEGMAHTLCSLLVIFITLKDLRTVSDGRG